VEKSLWPWQAGVIINYPWIKPAFFGSIAIVLSVFSWVRGKK
jgi:hypothetical protein